MREGLAPGQPIELGLRPEDIEITSEGAAGSIAFRIDFIEELGATQLFHGDVAGHAFVMQAATGDIASDTRKLWITVSPARLHLFDPTTGERLGLL